MANPSPKIILGLHRLRCRTTSINLVADSALSKTRSLTSPFMEHFYYCPSRASFVSQALNSAFPKLFYFPKVLAKQIRTFPHISSSNVAQSTESPCQSHASKIFFSFYSNSVTCSPKAPSKFSHVASPIGSFPTKNQGFNRVMKSMPLGFQASFFRSINSSKIEGNFVKSVMNKPLSSLKSASTRYREATVLQMEAFWKRNSLVLLGAMGLGLCIILWRIMFGIASTFVGLSEGMAKYGFLALASSIVAFSGLYVRSRYTINPDRVYRIAMRKLNTSAGILEVMGAPLSGTDLRAYVMSGGGLRLKNFKPRFSNKRCFLIFPIKGSERKGLVSVEAKKKKGQYDLRLLAVDIPMASGPDQRLFLIGDDEKYKVGGGLISELRDPIVKAMAVEKELEDLDQKEEEEDAERELLEAEEKQREEREKLEPPRS